MTDPSPPHRKFQELRDKMSPEAQARSKAEAERLLAVSPLVPAPPEPQQEVERIEGHLRTVTSSSVVWADLPEILDWYHRDVTLLLNLLRAAAARSQE